MKNILKLTITLATMALTFVACDKTDTPSGDNGSVDNSPLKERTIIYSVSNSESRKTLTTEAEWDAMLERFCDQAANGSEVVFYNMSQPTSLVGNNTKGDIDDSQTLNTTSRDEMKAWMKEMEKEGLTVKVTYDEGTGVWHGEAYATAPSANTSGNIIGTWHFARMVVSHFDENGQLMGSDLYEPEAGGGSMYYIFAEDSTLSLTMNGIGGITATDNSTWSLSDDGMLSSDLLPSGTYWNVNWITANTMILSSTSIGTEEGDMYYQLQFDRE